MTAEGTTTPPFRVARLATWVVVPLAALGVLRLFAPLELPRDPSTFASWLIPGTSGVLALAGLAAALLALGRGFQADGRLRDLLEGAGLGALSAAAAAGALGGPSQSPVFPTPVLPLGVAAAALALLSAEVVPPVHITGRGARLATAALIFGWVELAPAVGLLGPPILLLALALTAGAATLLAIAAISAAVGSPETSRSEWLLGLASSSLALGLARSGSADLMPGLVTMVLAVTLAVLTRPREPREGDEAMRPVALLSAPNGTEVEGVPPQTAESLRLARELRGTLAELLAARQTIELQRVELERAATVDATTGTATRRAILERLRVEAAEARRYAHPIALVLIDLDGTRGLNRTHGVEIGDEILRELGLRLRLRMREADGIGRVTSDTFLAILPHTDERGVTVFANALRTRLIERPVETRVGPLWITVSIGITVHRPGTDVREDELLGRAEEALASARAAGGNRIAFDRAHGLARLEERRADDAEEGADDTGEQRA
jgi:diguanylate cyclase (GGDEF)-like protein